MLKSSKTAGSLEQEELADLERGQDQRDREAQGVGLLSAGNGNSWSRWNRIMLLLRSVQAFISTANASPPLSSTSVAAIYTAVSDTSVIYICMFNQDADQLLHEETGDVDSLSFHSAFEKEQIGLELQRCQSSKIVDTVRRKDLESLRCFGGVEGVAEALDTDLERGIKREALFRRRNTLSRPHGCPAPPPPFSHFLWEASKSYTFIILTIGVVMSIVFNIKEEGLQNNWLDRAIAILTIIVLLAFPAVCKYRQERRSWKKYCSSQGSSESMKVDVIREGHCKRICISEIVCGDIVNLQRGCPVPADGLFVGGEALELDDGLKHIINHQNPFLFSGARVIHGSAQMIVAAVGKDTVLGEMMSTTSSTIHSPNTTTFEARFHKVSTCIHWIALLVFSILIPIVLFLRFMFGKMDAENGSGITSSTGEPTQFRMFIKAIKRADILTLLGVTLSGMMEGIPFVIAVALEFWNHKTLSDKASELNAFACVNMASVTVICTDRNSGLAYHQNEVDTLYIGNEVIRESSVLSVSPEVIGALCNGIGFSEEDSILCWAKDKLGMRNLEQSHENIMEHSRSNSFEEPCGALVVKNGDGGEGTSMEYWTGPAGMILPNCSHYYERDGQKQEIDYQKRMEFEQTNRDVIGKRLKTLAFAYKQTNVNVPTVLEGNNLTLVGMLALKNTSNEDTMKAIRALDDGGIKIILVSGDDASELAHIARECGLLTQVRDSDDQVIRGEDFKKFKPEERNEKVDQIRVMGNSNAQHKLLLTDCLRQKGETVAVIGQSTTDAPALKAADIGLAMGTWSDKARENCDILVCNGSFSISVSLWIRGRSIYRNIQKFIQLETIMSIAGSLINLIVIIFSGDAPMTAFELFWVNQNVAFLGGLALLTEPVTENVQAVNPAEALITKAMWRNIVTQALYQVCVLVTLRYKGQAILHTTENVVEAMVSNSFALCQFFNQFNAREQEGKNIFKGIHRNHWFWVALSASLVVHFAFAYMENILIGRVFLNLKLWTCCFLIGIISCPIDWAVKCMPIMLKKYWLGSCSMEWLRTLTRESISIDSSTQYLL